MSTDELVCKELVELITDYLEGALPPRERARFEAHLAACRPCREYLSQMRLTVGGLGKLPADGIPTDVQRDLLDVFRRWKQDSRGE